MSPHITQLTLPRFGESKRCASFYDLQARSFRAEKLTNNTFIVSLPKGLKLPLTLSTKSARKHEMSSS